MNQSSRRFDVGDPLGYSFQRNCPIIHVVFCSKDI